MFVKSKIWSRPCYAVHTYSDKPTGRAKLIVNTNQSLPLICFLVYTRRSNFLSITRYIFAKFWIPSVRSLSRRLQLRSKKFRIFESSCRRVKRLDGIDAIDATNWCIPLCSNKTNALWNFISNENSASCYRQKNVASSNWFVFAKAKRFDKEKEFWFWGRSSVHEGEMKIFRDTSRTCGNL